MKRNIIKIDDEKCNGCGECIPDCSEGALKIVDGKLKLVKESLCDGLGACVGRCPFGALTVEVREADEFDEEEAEKNMKEVEMNMQHVQESNNSSNLGCGCPGTMMQQWEDSESDVSVVNKESALRQWPVELKLLNSSALYFQNAHLLVSADCVPFAFSDFHHRFLQGKILVVFCPKLDNAHEEYIEKLESILKNNDIRSITVVHMEVPCCTATTHIVEESLKRSGKNVVLKDCTISLQGEIV